MVMVITRLPAMLLRAGQTEREDFVISGSSDLPVTGSPVERAVHDRWPIDYRASARKVPQDLSGRRIQRVHLSWIRAGMHDPVRNAHPTPVTAVSVGVCCLAEDLTRDNIQRAPRTPAAL